MAMWIPLDVKVHWFSFLSAPDLANCGGVCKAWLVLVNRTYEAEWRKTTGVAPPRRLPRVAKLMLLRRIRRPLAAENWQFLATMAAGRVDMLPYLHHLLLLRDHARLQLGIPGGLYQTQHSARMHDLVDEHRALFTSRGGHGFHPDWGHTTPLLQAVQTGNHQAVHLLLMFGESPNAKAKNGMRPIVAAAQQGNPLVMEALLGRTPLRPPEHPRFLARRLGLYRETRPGVGTHGEWVSGRDRILETLVAAERAREEANVAKKGARSATAAMARLNGVGEMDAQGRRVRNINLARGDGRYQRWCRGLDCGVFWSVYDTAVEDRLDLEEGFRNEEDAEEQEEGQEEEDEDEEDEEERRRQMRRRRTEEEEKEEKRWRKHEDKALELKKLASPPWRLKKREKGSGSGSGSLKRLPAPAGTVALAESRARRRDGRHIHPANLEVVDEGAVAAHAIQTRVRVNATVDGRTALYEACVRGRSALALLLLSHADPGLLDAATPPPLPPPPATDEGGRPIPAAARAPMPEAFVEATTDGGEHPCFAWAGAPFPLPAAAKALVMGHRRRCDPDLHPPGQHTALGQACARGDERCAALLVHFGADPNLPGHKEATPLLVAATAGHEHIVGLLLKALLPPAAASRVHAAIDDLREKYKSIRQARTESPEQDENQDQKIHSSGGGASGTSPQNIHSSGGGGASGTSSQNIQSSGGGSSSSSSSTLDQVPAELEVLRQRWGVTRATWRAALAAGNVGGPGFSDAARECAAAWVDASSLSSDRHDRVLQRLADESSSSSSSRVPIAVRRAALAAAQERAAAGAVPEPLTFRPTAEHEAILLDALQKSDALIRSSAKRLARRSAKASPSKHVLSGATPSKHVLSGAASSSSSPSKSSSSSSVVKFTPPPQRIRGVPEEPVIDTCMPLMWLAQRLLEGEVQPWRVFRAAALARVDALRRRSRAIKGSGLLPAREHLEIDLDRGDESGFTPLYNAAMAGRADSVQVLLAAGANPRVQTKRGKTILYGAVEKGHAPVVRALLPYVSAVEIRRKTTFGTDVMHAAGRCGSREVQELLEARLSGLDAAETRRLEAMEAERRWGKASKSAKTRAKHQSGVMNRLVTGAAGAIGEVSEEDGEVAAAAAARLAQLRRAAAAAREAEERRQRARSVSRTRAGSGGAGRARQSVREPADNIRSTDSTTIPLRRAQSMPKQRPKKEEKTSQSQKTSVSISSGGGGSSQAPPPLPSTSSSSSSSKGAPKLPRSKSSHPRAGRALSVLNPRPPSNSKQSSSSSSSGAAPSSNSTKKQRKSFKKASTPPRKRAESPPTPKSPASAPATSPDRSMSTRANSQRYRGPAAIRAAARATIEVDVDRDEFSSPPRQAVAPPRSPLTSPRRPRADSRDRSLTKDGEEESGAAFSTQVQPQPQPQPPSTSRPSSVVTSAAERAREARLRAFGRRGSKPSKDNNNDATLVGEGQGDGKEDEDTTSTSSKTHNHRHHHPVGLFASGPSASKKSSSFRHENAETKSPGRLSPSLERELDRLQRRTEDLLRDSDAAVHSAAVSSGASSSSTSKKPPQHPTRPVSPKWALPSIPAPSSIGLSSGGGASSSKKLSSGGGTSSSSSQKISSGGGTSSSSSKKLSSGASSSSSTTEKHIPTSSPPDGTKLDAAAARRLLDRARDQAQQHVQRMKAAEARPPPVVPKRVFQSSLRDAESNPHALPEPPSVSPLQHHQGHSSSADLPLGIAGTAILADPPANQRVNSLALAAAAYGVPIRGKQSRKRKKSKKALKPPPTDPVFDLS